MPLVYDSVLAGALAAALDERWAGRRLDVLRFDPDRRAIVLRIEAELWVWALHPNHGALRLVPAPQGESRRSRRSRDRGILESSFRISSVVSPADTRRVEIELAGPRELEARIAIHLVTNRFNAAFVRDGQVRRVLLPTSSWRGVDAGAAWASSGSERSWRDAPPSAATWDGEIETADPSWRRRHVAWLSRLNETWVFESGEPGTSYDRYLALRGAAGGGTGGWLVRRPAGGAFPYPLALGHAEEDHSNVVAAIGAWAERHPEVEAVAREAAEPPALQELRHALEQRLAKATKKRRALEQQYEAGSDAEAKRAIGHLLLARQSDVPAGASEATLEDFDGSTTRVELDPRLDAPSNARRYYDLARKLDRARSALPARIDRATAKIDRLERALEGLDDLPPPESRAWRLAGLPAGGRNRSARTSGGRKDAGERLPYRQYRTSGGLEVRAGRSAADNDELTFRHSAPDDIWMHVNSSPGSHVILRWGRRDQNPPEADIHEAAVVAAVASRARGSRLVPVSWTRRKYVRKPRKAGAGTVTTERTSTVFVEPDAARVARMSVDDD